MVPGPALQHSHPTHRHGKWKAVLSPVPFTQGISTCWPVPEISQNRRKYSWNLSLFSCLTRPTITYWSFAADYKMFSGVGHHLVVHPVHCTDKGHERSPEIFLKQKAFLHSKSAHKRKQQASKLSYNLAFQLFFSAWKPVYIAATRMSNRQRKQTSPHITTPSTSLPGLQLWQELWDHPGPVSVYIISLMQFF